MKTAFIYNLIRTAQKSNPRETAKTLFQKPREVEELGLALRDFAKNRSSASSGNMEPRIVSPHLEALCDIYQASLKEVCPFATQLRLTPHRQVIQVGPSSWIPKPSPIPRWSGLAAHLGESTELLEILKTASEPRSIIDKLPCRTVIKAAMIHAEDPNFILKHRELWKSLAKAMATITDRFLGGFFSDEKPAQPWSLCKAWSSIQTELAPKLAQATEVLTLRLGPFPTRENCSAEDGMPDERIWRCYSRVWWLQLATVDALASPGSHLNPTERKILRFFQTEPNLRLQSPEIVDRLNLKRGTAGKALVRLHKLGYLKNARGRAFHRGYWIAELGQTIDLEQP